MITWNTLFRSIPLATIVIVVLLVLATGSVSAAPRQQATVVNICDRTPEVQTAILAKIPSSPACDAVTDTHLAGIDGDLIIVNYSSPKVLGSDFAGLTGDIGRLYINFSPLVTEVEANAFDGFTSLRTLSLRYNGLTTLDADIFDGLTSLENVELHGNDLTTLDADIFDGLTGLRHLWLSENSLTALDADIFDGLTSLEYLHLYKNALTELDEGIFDGLTSLQYLRLNSNNFGTLPVDLFDPLNGSLEHLTLSGNDLTALDEGIFDDLTGLKNLHLSSNALTALDEGIFDGLTGLKNLDLSSNALTALDEGIFDGLTSLQWLYLHRNSFTALPTDLFDPLDNSLTRLALSFNSLTSLDEDIFDGLTGLQYLYLNDNDLTALDEDIFDGLTSLAQLYLLRNSLTALPADLFDPLDNSLTLLRLEGNSLTALDADIFDGLGGLQSLDLSNNSLDALTAGVFEDLDDSLTRLYLRTNNLTALPETIFTGLTGLQYLDLSCNSLTALDLTDPTPFDPFAGTLRYLDVGANNFATAPTETAVRAKLTRANLILHLTGTAPCPSSYDTGLSGLMVSEGTLDPAFAEPGTAWHTVEVGPHVTKIEITPTPRASGATLENFRRMDAYSGITLEVLNDLHTSLKYDWNTFRFVVRAKDGVTTWDYLVRVIRHHALNARLSSLTLSGITLTPSFDSGVFTYAADGTSSVTSTTVTPVLSNSNATAVIKLNGTVDADGTVDLELGSNVITVEVTAEDGTTKRTYTVTVTRAGRPGKVLVSKKLLSLTEGNTGYYSVVLDRQPAANVTVTIGGHAGTNVTPNPTSLTFTTTNWSRSQQVFVSTTADTNTTNESFPLTHTATSSDSLFDGITIPSVIVNVDDQDAPDHHIRTITVPYGLPLGETALPEEEFEVWIGPPFEETIEGVTQGHRWSPSGLWGNPDADIIWVVDPIHFGIHALKLSALKQGRVERHIAADTAEFDHRFNYRCHFSESRASGYGNPSLTVMWGSPTRVLIANESSGTLDAYDRDSSITNQCYTRNVTSWAADGQSYTTADENFKSPFGFVREFDLPLGPLTVRGIWANSTQVWLSGPTAGVYTLALGGSRRMNIAPGYDGHTGSSNGLWSDGTTMWVAADSGWLRAYNLNSGSRRAEFDIRIQTYGMTPGDIWSDGETIWVTNRMGNIDAYRLPGTSGGSRTPRATEADPLTASFALAPEAHDGENGFKLRIAFSDDVEITPEDMRDHALTVSGGTVTDAARVKGRSDLWELTVEPAGPGPVSILAPLGRACTDQGALCTADGRSLTAGPALQVPGPPAQQANSQATGAPSISGTAQVGETLTAGTSDIADDDGLTNVSYSYQWIRSDGSTDTSIQDATGSSYTLSEADEGQTVKVTVSFADDADNKETLTSTATAAVAAGAPTDPPGNPRNLTGAANSDGTVTLSWDAPNDDSVTGYQILRRRPSEGEKTLLVHVNDTGSAATEYTDSDVTPDVRHVYRVKAINAAGLSSWSNFVRVTPTQPAEPARNSPPTGMLTIGGTVQVGETLTADTSGIADDDGLTNVSYGYQWIVTDGGADIDITSATDSSYTLADADEGLAIKVKVSFTDDAGNEESLTSAATDDVASA